MVLIPAFIAVAMISVDHDLVVLLVEDLIAANALALAVAHLSGTAVIHSALRSSLRRAVLLLLCTASVLLGPGKPAWLVLVLHGFLVRALRVISHDFLSTRGRRLLLVDFETAAHLLNLAAMFSIIML